MMFLKTIALMIFVTVLDLNMVMKVNISYLVVSISFVGFIVIRKDFNYFMAIKVNKDYYFVAIQIHLINYKDLNYYLIRLVHHIMRTIMLKIKIHCVKYYVLLISLLI